MDGRPDAKLGMLGKFSVSAVILFVSLLLGYIVDKSRLSSRWVSVSYKVMPIAAFIVADVVAFTVFQVSSFLRISGIILADWYISGKLARATI